MLILLGQLFFRLDMINVVTIHNMNMHKHIKLSSLHIDIHIIAYKHGHYWVYLYQMKILEYYLCLLRKLCRVFIVILYIIILANFSPIFHSSCFMASGSK